MEVLNVTVLVVLVLEVLCGALVWFTPGLLRETAWRSNQRAQALESSRAAYRAQMARGKR